MKLTARALNRTTLSRQLLLRRERLSVAEGVRRIVAVQAQSPASPYLAVWNRLADVEPADVDAVFAARHVVKASLMRITLHAVHAEDYPAFHTAMIAALRASRLNDRRFTSTGLTAADIDALLPVLVEFADEPRSGAELQAMLKHRFGVTEDRVWWAFRTMAPLLHAPVGGPWSFGDRPTFVASGVEPGDVDDAVRHLIVRYLEGFGPASVRDFTQFAILPQRLTKSAWAALADDVVELQGPDGEQLFDVPGAARADEDTVAPPRLLGMWESVLLAYADRSRIIPSDYRAIVIRRNGDVLPTLLVDGYVAGVWRALEDGIEVTAFRKLPAKVWSAIEAEAVALRAFLAERDPLVYRRYRRWWERLSGDEVRVVG